MASPALPTSRRPWLGPLRRRRLRRSWRLLPRTLFGRSLLIVLLPLLILQAVLAYVFYERHWETVTRWLALGFAGEIELLVEQLERAGDARAREEVLALAREHLDLDAVLEPGARLAPEAAGGWLALPPPHADRALQETFADALGRPFRLDTEYPDPKRFAVHVQLADGVLRVVAPRKRVDSTTTTVFTAWMIGLSVLLLAVAVFFLRRQVRPIRRLVQAADSFGKGRDVGDFKLEGALEIRQAGAAFNLMRRRILRHIAQRTEMLAAVSHDLRTPLTRMKLELEMLGGGGAPGDARAGIEDLRADVEEMARLVESYLAFARGEGAQEAMAPTRLDRLLTEVVDRARRDGHRVDLLTPEPIELPLRPVAFRRCLANLIENACRYGRRVVVQAVSRGDAAVEVTVDDDGPGIPPEQRAEVFKPFRRIEGSRNPHTGGVGLGLTIARDIALAHGGDIALTASPLGGLRATVRIPR